MRAVDLAHTLIRQTLKPGDCAVDATVGNGHDTRLLAELVGEEGHVIGFDVQEAALKAAAERLEGLPQVRLVHAGHENLAEYLPAEIESRLSAVMFNLGYLPGGPKDIITESETTLRALEQALAHLKTHGLVTLVLYPGHEGGEEEAEAVRSFARALSQEFSVTHFARLNAQCPAPELIAIERVG